MNRSPSVTLFIALASATFMLGPARSSGLPMREHAEEIQAARHVLEQLSEPAFETRLAAIEESWRPWGLFNSRYPADDHEVEPLLVSIRGWAAAEPDDFLVSRFLGKLFGFRDERLTPLFEEALRHPSPNVRRRAVQWLTTNHAPRLLDRLESMSRTEDRPWVRPDLALALACQAWEKHSSGLAALARSSSAEVVASVTYTLSARRSDEAVKELIRIASYGPTDARATAIEELASIKENPQVARSMIGLASSDHQESRRAALKALGEFRTPESRVTLLRAVRGDADARLQKTAIMALASAYPAERQAILTQVLPWLDGDSVDCAMTWLGRPPESWELEPEDPDPHSASLPEQPGCEGWSIGLEHHRPDEISLAASRGRQSQRCWLAPERAGATPSARLAAGTAVTAVDVFEAGAELWYEVEVDDEDYCWIRSAGLEPPQPAVSLPRASVVVEFDARREFLDTREARLLDDVGLLESFDVARHVTGVAVEIPLEDLAAAIRVLEVYHLSDATLREHLRPAVRALRRHHPEWDLFDGIWLGDEPDPGPAIRGRNPQALDTNSR